ncbi:glutamate 5-kinase, partial [Aestuariivirga sp.]|uniref:glutamate 5-kinase n=1 Tax=Aestuariivirga sp. TaxID=2650926 RepID=UPI0035B07189
MAAVKSRLEQARRIVVKIGSALLVDAKTGTIKASWLSSLIDDLADQRVKGAEIIIVSSGAIALGRRTLGLPKGTLRLEQKQAAAAVGQIALAQAWTEALRTRNMVAAQVLVTLTDTEERRRYLNARATLSTLLEQGAVPVINENDTVATSEIRYGDNDRLAARVASMMSADCLVLLSDIDGLYTAPPNQKGATFLPVVEEITPEIEAMAGKPVSGVGSGGMITKIEAGKIALGAGCNMVIASGHEMHPLKRIRDGARCTWFVANASALQSRKRWIAGTLQPIGHLVVDEGAAEALAKGKSLLPAGVRKVEGSFAR